MPGRFFKRRGNIVAATVFLLMLVFFIDTGMRAYAQTRKKHEIQEEQNFNRPEPSRPIQPEVPSVNRYQEDKVFLEYADSLFKVNNNPFDTVERQILKGNVKFRQAGLWMFCDSAYYYPELNSLDAFSNVRMEQGDTLFVYADKLFYNGDIHLAKLKNGPTREKVTMINKDVTLTTDSLDYDMEIDLGWYSKWGTIFDQVNTLTSLYGQYSPETKQAIFYHDVVLVNLKDNYRMLTDTLYYSTATHIANIESKTEIQSENDTIITDLATYFTDTGNADLLSRSLIIHRDSTGNVTTLEGDSIIYDNTTRISRAYMFRDFRKTGTPMVITDTAQKTQLIGGFGMYNDSTREALATIYPLLIEYSQGDTLFLRADTIKTFIITELIAEKKKKTKSGYPEFRGVPVLYRDSLTGKLYYDTTYFKITIPLIDEDFAKLKWPKPYVPPQEIPDLPIPDQRLMAEVDSAINVQDTLTGLVNFPDSLEMSSLPDSIPEEREIVVENLPVPDISYLPPDSIPTDFHIVLAYHRGRFFKQDMQGVADSMVFVERDSMLYLFRKPIIWSGERQVTGNRIDVHFNDSTTDWAYLPEFGLMSEHVEEDFYNQIYGKEITTYFENQGLRRMNVSGNVETIFLPQEEDSTYNRLVTAESSYLEAYLDSNKLDWLKMWPEVTGSVTPLFLIKRAQMYLQKFKWWSFLRPERAWYGEYMKWEDNLGEVPDELEQYFLAPSDFGEPKSFTGPRIILQPTSLPPVPEDATLPDLPIGILEEEESITLEDIEHSEEEMDNFKEETEKQSLEIEGTVESQDPDIEEDPGLIEEITDE